MKLMERDKTDQYGFDSEPVGVTFTAKVRLADMREALKHYEAGCKPLPRKQTLQNLAALRVLTASRAADGDDTDLLFQVYARQLEGYPADVVTHVLVTQANESRWWPTWLELKERLDLHARKRLLRRDALRAKLAEMEKGS